MKESQNDYFTILEKNNALFIAVADGLSDKKTGRKAAVSSIKILRNNFVYLDSYQNIKLFFKNSFGDIHNYLKIIKSNKAGAVILCAVVMKNKVEWSSMGNCALFLYRKKELIRLNKQEMIQFETCEIKKKEILLFCTQGVYKSLTEMDMICVLSEKINAYEKAQKLSKMIIDKKYSYQDNATIIVLEKK